MEEETGIAVSISSKKGNLRHVLVTGLSQDQEDELYVAVEAVYADRLMSDYLQTCEFWVEDFPVDELRHVIQAKLTQMDISFSEK